MKATTMNTSSLSLPWTRLATACLLTFLSHGASAAQAALVAPQQVAPHQAAHAPQAAAIAWTPSTLRQTLASLPKGDASAGQQVHVQLFCASCHGAKGVAPTQNWPHLAGQKAAYTAKMLLDYQSGLRQEGKRAELMHDIAVMMTPQQIADVSAFYAQQAAPQDDGTPRPKPQMAAKDVAASQLVRKGDPSRLLTPCASCHGVAGQGGNREASALAGQNPLYFVRTLLDYQSGLRANDSARGMSTFAKKLSRTEIEALATYYADLPARQANQAR
jgi:cytochrome c553